MKAQKLIILLSLLLWTCICVAGAFHFGNPLVGAILVFVPLTLLFPNVTGFLAYSVEPVYATILCALAVFAWRRRSTPVAVVFCCVLLSSAVFGWILFERGCAWKSNVSAKMLNVGISTKDEDVRDRLLLYTPKGSDATNVLAFIVDDLHPKWDFLSYFAYADALQVGRTGRLNVVREDERWPGLEPPPPDWTPRFIYLVIGTYSDGNYIWKITANWKFDKNDKLVSITVGRDNSP